MSVNTSRIGTFYKVNECIQTGIWQMEKAFGFFFCGQKFILNKQRLEHYMRGHIPPHILYGNVTISQINSMTKKMQC